VTRALPLAALATGWLQAVTISIPNAAVFHIGGAFSMQDDEVGWLFSSYITASAVTMPLMGQLAARFGRKALFQSCIALFAAGLVLATDVHTLGGFIAARILQGAASGPLAPLSLAILLDHAPPSRHPRLTLIASLSVMAGILSGPPLGGWISEHHDWRWIFWMGLPLSGWIFLATALGLEEKRSVAAPFDWTGFGALALGFSGLQLVLDRGERLEWFASGEIRLEAFASALGFTFLLAHVLTARHHFFDKTLLRDRNFTAATAMFFAFGFVLLPTVALTSPMLEELLGYPPDTTGTMTIPRSIALLLAMALSARTTVDNRLVILTGLALTAWANARMLAYSPLMDAWPVVAAGMLQGAGLGLLMPALSKAAFATLPPAMKPEGLAVFNLARLYGSTLGIAVVQWFLYDGTQAMHLALASAATAHRTTLYAPALLSGSGPALLNETITGQAAMVALLGQFKILMFAMILACPLALLLRKPRPLAQP
jgi:DHA2 family multidrug resistance protein